MSATQAMVALGWIKDEVGQTLDQAQIALQAASEAPENKEEMRSCLTAIHQVHGTFLMAALKGPTEVAREMETLAQALVDNLIKEVESAQEMLMQSILQMPRFLDNIQRQQRELPQVSLSIVNKLRSARGAEDVGHFNITETAFDFTMFTSASSDLAKIGFEKLNGAINAPKLRHKYLQALVAIFKKDNPRGNLALMGKVLTMLERLCGETSLGHLAVIMGAFVEALAAGSIRLDNRSGNCLKRMDIHLKRLAELGAEELDTPIAEEFVKEILSRIFNAQKVTSKMLAVKSKYIVKTKDSASDVALEMAPDNETLGKVISILMNELKGVTDKIDLYSRVKPGDKADLVSMLPLMKQISNTMSMVGLVEPQEMLNKQLTNLKQLDLSADEPIEEQILEMAQAFLEIETRMASVLDDSKDLEELAGIGSLGEVTSVVVKEARVGLSICTQAIAGFISSNWNHETIEGLSELLIALRGSLRMLEQQRAADVMLSCARYVEKIYLETDSHPENEDLDSFADAITCIDYYLERLLENNIDAMEPLIDLAEKSVMQLGYEVSEVLERELKREIEVKTHSSQDHQPDFSDSGDNDSSDDDLSDKKIETFAEDDEETTLFRGQIHEAADRIRKLSTKSDRVGDVVLLINELVSLVSDIADHANILSPDADLRNSMNLDTESGIFSAASEVQRLAERSGMAAKQLSELVNLVQKNRESDQQSKSADIASLTSAEQQETA